MTRGIIYTRPSGGHYAFSKIDGFAEGNPTASQEQDMSMCWWTIEVDDYEKILKTLREVLAPMYLSGTQNEYNIHPQKAKDLLRIIAGTPVAPKNDIHGIEAYEPKDHAAVAVKEEDTEDIKSRDI